MRAVAPFGARKVYCAACRFAIADKPTPQLVGAEVPLLGKGRRAYMVNLPLEWQWD
jgi:hypothetical protein